MCAVVGVGRMPGFLPYAMAIEAFRALKRVDSANLASMGLTSIASAPPPIRMPRARRSAGGVGTGEALPPIARLGDSERDMAPLIMFLAGPGAGYFTDYPCMVDGGVAIAAAH